MPMFSVYSTVEASDQPLKNCPVRVQSFVVVFSDQVRLYHQCSTGDDLQHNAYQQQNGVYLMYGHLL